MIFAQISKKSEVLIILSGGGTCCPHKVRKEIDVTNMGHGHNFDDWCSVIFVE